MQLSELSWTTADETDADVVLLPVGSTEQHGPHAPLGTDAMTATAVANEAADQYDGTALVGPTVPVGVAAEHRQFPGTMWVSEDTFRAYVRESVESLASHGWETVILVNGHGGNVAALREVCGTLVREETAYAVPFTWFDAVAYDDIDADVRMGHGGPVETSLVWHLRPDLIDTDAFEQAATDGAEGWGEFQSGVNLAFDSAEFTDSGAVGDPSDGSPELGEQLLANTTAALVTLIERVTARDNSRPPHR